MGLELNRVRSINKKIQVEIKHKTRRDKTKCASTQQNNVDRQNAHRCDNRHEERRQHGRSPSLDDINSTNSGLEEEYDRIFLRDQQDAMAIRKHNSDISDFITIMAMEDNLQLMRDEAAPSEGEDSRRLRASESDLKAIMSGHCKKTCCGNRPRDTEAILDIDNCSIDFTYERVKEIIRQDMKGWEEQCACMSRKKAHKVNSKSSPWEKVNEIFSCDRTCSKKNSRRGQPQRKGSSCCCKEGGTAPNRKESDKMCSPKEPPPCVKCCSRSNMQVYQESDVGTAAITSSGAGQACSSNTCPPCQLCQQGCAALKLSPSEERITLERDMARCDCKRKLLRLRLMKAFNVCPKCRLPRTMCRCLEEIIREYRRREVEKEIEIKRNAIQLGGECSCESDDPFAKLIHEVANTCPKCGHWRNDCTCLEEMIVDVKRLMLKKSPQYNNGNDQGNDKSCKCLDQSKRGSSRQNFMYQTTNVGNISCDKCEGISINVDGPPPEDSINSAPCTYNSSKTCGNVHISKNSSPLQYSPSRQVMMSIELQDTNGLSDTCNVCKKRTTACECKVLDNVRVGEGEQSESLERESTEASAKAETTKEYCECTEEAVDGTGRVRMCEECVRPLLHCVCKQSPTCYKCGKYRCENSERYPHRQSKFGSDRPRSRTRHRCSESVRTAPNIITRYERTPQDDAHIESRQETLQASEESAESRFLPAKTKACGERCSQSAFQKLKSHFRRCNSCGKKDAKKTNESIQIQCTYDAKVYDKETNGKEYKKSRKPDEEKKRSAEHADIPLASKRSRSMKRHKHQAL